MRTTFSLGRISGIRIGVNWSVLLIIVLLVYGLAVGQFPAAAPRRPAAEYVIAAVLTALAYLASLRRLQALDLALILPGHGAPIERPYEKIAEYIAHRLMRERQVVGALEQGLATVDAMVPRLYAEVHPALHPAAALTVRAHLAKLVHEGVVREEPGDRFALAR